MLDPKPKKLQMLGKFASPVKSINGVEPDENGNVDIRADWSENDSTAAGYVTNRTHWCESEYTELYNGTVRFTEHPYDTLGIGGINYILDGFTMTAYPTAGHTPPTAYVTIDGVRYECALPSYADSYIDNGLSEYKVAVGDSDYIAFTVTYRGYNALVVVCTQGLINSHFIIEVGSEVYHQLDEKFIPDTIARIPDWNQWNNTATDYIKNRPFYECTDFGPGNAFTDEETFTCETTGSSYVITTDSPLTPQDGQSFYITFDGSSHQCHVETFDVPGAADGTQETGMGNKHIRYPDLEDNGLPFYLHCTYWGMYVFMVYSNPGTHTIQIFEDKHALKQIDEKYIPDTIARKTDVPEIQEQVQADWNQNDETAIDYVKNRTHYMTLVEVPIEGALAYDGVHVSSINGEHNFHKMCEVESKPEEYRITLWDTTRTNKVIDIADVANDCSEYFVNYPPANGWLVVREHIDGERYNLYAGSANDFTYNGIPFSGSVFVNQAQPLDEKYIPDTIARKTDIPTDIPTDTHINGLINTALSNVNRTQVQSDWAQLDETAVDYIKNKPFGESIHIGEALFDKATVEKDSSTVKISNFAVFDIRLDKYYYVVFDNIEYCCKSVSYSGRRWLGNLVYAYPFKDNTGEPFLIEYNCVAGVSTSRYLYCEDNSHTIQIFNAEYDVVPIAEKYITNNVRYRPVKVPLFERVLKTGFTGYSGSYYIRLDDSEQIDSGFTDGWLYLKNNYYRVTVDEYFDVLYNDGKIMHTAPVRIVIDSNGPRLCTNSASAPFTLDNEPVRIYSMDGVEPVILPDECVPDTIARKTDIPSKASAVPDAAGDTVTAEEFNALLTALRNAGYLTT